MPKDCAECRFHLDGYCLHKKSNGEKAANMRGPTFPENKPGVCGVEAALFVRRELVWED